MQLPFDIGTVEELYRNAEEGKSGYYPIGTGNFWHSGIHINYTGGSNMISPLLSGKVAAYRLSTAYKQVSLPEKLLESEMNGEFSAYRDKYDEIKESGIVMYYELKDSLKSEEKTYSVSDNFILLKHSVETDALQSRKLVFYSLYMNLAPVKEKLENYTPGKTYPEKMCIDGAIHIEIETPGKDDDSIFLSTVGKPGYAKGDRYFDLVMFTEKNLFDYKEKWLGEKKLLFHHIPKRTKVYKKDSKAEPDSEQWYIPAHSTYKELDTYTDEGQTVKKIQITTIRVYLDSSDCIGKKTRQGTYPVTDIQKLWMISKKCIDFSTGTSPECDYIYKRIKNRIAAIKTDASGIIITNTIGSGKNSQPGFDLDTEKYADTPFICWVYETGSFRGGEIKEAGLHTIYKNNPLAYTYKETSFSEDEMRQVNDIGEQEYISTENKKYKKLKDMDGYITKNDAEKCMKPALEWEDWFYEIKEDIGKSKDIFCDKTEYMKVIISLYENSRKKMNFPTMPLEVWWMSEKLLDVYLKGLLGIGEKYEFAETLLSQMRKSICTHPLEWDKTLFTNIKDDYNSRSSWLKNTLAETTAKKLQDESNASDLWNGCLSILFKGGNKLHFVHPVYFLNHLERTGILEFNPYKNYSRKYKKENGYTTGNHLEDYDLEVRDNPGFAPLATDGNLNTPAVMYAGIRYAGCSSPFDILRVGSGSTEKAVKKLRHTGIDLSPGGKTPIVSLISGTVWAYTNDDITYGNLMIIKDDNRDYLYILAHIDGKIKNVNDHVSPGDKVAVTGGVGPGDTVYPIHLHLEIRECRETKVQYVLDKTKNKSPEIKKGTFAWVEKYLNGAYPGPKRLNPFNHSKEYKL